MASGETYTIGKVVKKLSAAFPDLTVSKVRYLESEGLVTPMRTKSGYRTYSDRDVERLETVLRLQKTCFYPLSVIKERLDALEEGETPEELSSTEARIDDEALLGTSHLLEDIPDLVNVPVAFVRTLNDMGLLQISRNAAGRQLVDGQDIPLIRAAYELKRYGIDPRFLKAHVQRTNREVPLFKQVLSSTIGRQASFDDPKTLQSFDATLERLLELNDTVSDCLTRRELRREFKHPASRQGSAPSGRAGGAVKP